jgi:hypothetical protein
MCVYFSTILDSINFKEFRFMYVFPEKNEAILTATRRIGSNWQPRRFPRSASSSQPLANPPSGIDSSPSSAIPPVFFIVKSQ